MGEIEEVKVYQFEGTLTQEWQGSDDSGHWQRLIKGKNSDDLIADLYRLLESTVDEGEVVERKVLVRIELL